MIVRKETSIAQCIFLLISVIGALFVSMFLVSPLPAFADETTVTFQSDSVEGVAIYYTVTDSDTVAVGRENTAQGTNYAIDSGYSGSLTIPSQVQYNDTTYDVTAIQARAFSNGWNAGCILTEVILPATLQSIGEHAFSYTSLVKVDTASAANLLSIGKAAFQTCKYLDSIVIPAKVATVGSYAFAYNDVLASVTFATGSEIVTMGTGAFSGSSSKGGSLTTFTIPASLTTIPGEILQYQRKLTTVTFEGSSYEAIGDRAFAGCTSLAAIDIPSLTGTSNQIGMGSFYGCTALATIVFTSDANTYSCKSLDSNGPFWLCTGLKNVVYHGTAWGMLVNSMAGTTTGDGFPSTSDEYYYHTVTFYASQSDAEAGYNPLGYARVRNDVTVAVINSGALSVTGISPELFQDGGSIPDLSSGSAWAFEGDLAVSDVLSNSCYAYQISKYDMNQATIEMDAETFAYTGEPINIGYLVSASSGTVLQNGTDYTAIIYKDGVVIDADKVIERGTYTLEITGIGEYAGSLTTSFNVGVMAAAWEWLYGDDRYQTMQAVVRAAFPEKGTTDTIILASGTNFPDALAASSLAGLENAPIVLTDGSKLSDAAATEIRRLAVRNVVVIGGSGAISDSVVEEVKNLSTRPSVSRVSGADRYATAAKIYTVAKGSGLGASGTAIICSGWTAADALSIAPYAYATKSPIFLTNGEGVLDEATCTIIKDAGFTRVILAGGSAPVSEAVKIQLANAGLIFERWSGDDRYGTSVSIAENSVEEGILTYDNAVLVNGTNAAFPDALSASALCGQKSSVLLLVDDNTAGKRAVDEILSPQRYTITTGYFVGGESRIPTSFRNMVLALWE